MILPSMGVISEIISAFCARRSSATTLSPFRASPSRCWVPGVGPSHVRLGPVVYAACLLGHQLPGGDPVGGEGLQLDATLYKGSIAWDAPMLYAMGFIGLFTIAG